MNFLHSTRLYIPMCAAQLAHTHIYESKSKPMMYIITILPHTLYIIHTGIQSQTASRESYIYIRQFSCLYTQVPPIFSASHSPSSSRSFLALASNLRSEVSYVTRRARTESLPSALGLFLLLTRSKPKLRAAAAAAAVIYRKLGGSGFDLLLLPRSL